MGERRRERALFLLRSRPAKKKVPSALSLLLSIPDPKKEEEERKKALSRHLPYYGGGGHSDAMLLGTGEGGGEGGHNMQMVRNAFL